MCDLSQNAVCPCLGWVLSRLLLTALSGPVLLAACEGVAVAGGDSSEVTPGQQVLGLLVWTLIAGTEYFRVPAFGWVMFVAVFYWVLTVFFLIIYITMTYTRIPQVPWTTVGLCFNGSAFALYLSAAIVDASSVSLERDSHNFNSWAASSFFAFLVTICYAGNTYFSFVAWRSRTIQ
ncbi:CKLF-like MARVEL transmembrane domain-containing protein 8 [Camelus dromedarius]|uniref:CKLF-like MARVEL transmembrane domain-containing protein 8 n=1 Tax=Camelus dromedarius TaxID=9838 RepID=A0A5N4CZC7_CAMDR|nr:CKLF-like MARVEL transmembrane domain-containing protein 8 [Camelus dromedarius]